MSGDFRSDDTDLSPAQIFFRMSGHGFTQLKRGTYQVYCRRPYVMNYGGRSVVEPRSQNPASGGCKRVPAFARNIFYLDPVVDAGEERREHGHKVGLLRVADHQQQHLQLRRRTDRQHVVKVCRPDGTPQNKNGRPKGSSSRSSSGSFKLAAREKEAMGLCEIINTLVLFSLQELRTYLSMAD